MMYISKTNLAKKENLTPDEASEIWNAFYFSGWSHWPPKLVLFASIIIVYYLAQPFWYLCWAILLIHSLIALPLASKEMQLHVKNTGKKASKNA